MKRRYCFLFIAVLGLGACKKFLATSPTDPSSGITADLVYGNTTQLSTALTGVYNNILSGNYNSRLNIYLGLADEASYQYIAANSVYAYNHDYTNGDLNALWSTLYSGINNDNLLLTHIPDTTKVLPAAYAPAGGMTVSQIRGEALFLRGFAYYLLACNFGDVPLKLSATSGTAGLSVPRTPSAQIYEQALSDMESALPYLKTAMALNSSLRISQTAAQGIIARACLGLAGQPNNQTKYYDSALYYSSMIIKSGLHSLYTGKRGVTTPDSSYQYVFIQESQQKYSPQECMFEVGYFSPFAAPLQYNGGNGFNIGIGYAGVNDNSIGFCRGNVVAFGTLYKLYSPGDLRRDWNIGTFVYGGANADPTKVARTARPAITTTGGVPNWPFNRYPGKWRREYETVLPKYQYGSTTSTPILRYADVLLMYAEAYNQVYKGPTGGSASYGLPAFSAADAVNQIRRRGYGQDINTASSVADTTVTTQAAFQNLIVDERSRELCYEAVRLYDLRRWGLFTSKMRDLLTMLNTTNAFDGSTKTYLVIEATNATASSRQTLFPIPSGEISTNPACTQNPGW